MSIGDRWRLRGEYRRSLETRSWTLKGVNGDLSFALCILLSLYSFLTCFICLCQNPLCFVLTFLILITF